MTTPLPVRRTAPRPPGPMDAVSPTANGNHLTLDRSAVAPDR